MGQAVPLSAAKVQLAGLVQAAEAGEVVHISRHGHPVAVLLSEQAYAALQGQQQGQRVWDAIAHWRGAARARHADDWPLTSGDGTDSWRDRSPGREVPLE